MGPSYHNIIAYITAIEPTEQGSYFEHKKITSRPIMIPYEVSVVSILSISEYFENHI